MTHNIKPYNYARKKIIECRTTDTITSVAKLFHEEGVGSALVKDQSGKHAGLITDSTLFKAIANGVNVTQIKVEDLKLEELVVVSKDADLAEVLEKFNKTQVRRIAMADSSGKIVAVLKKNLLDRFMLFEAGPQITKKS